VGCAAGCANAGVGVAGCGVAVSGTTRVAVRVGEWVGVGKRVDMIVVGSISPELSGPRVSIVNVVAGVMNWTQASVRPIAQMNTTTTANPAIM
jgi:hypothetical protein